MDNSEFSKKQLEWLKQHYEYVEKAFNEPGYQSYGFLQSYQNAASYQEAFGGEPIHQVAERYAAYLKTQPDTTSGNSDEG